MSKNATLEQSILDTLDAIVEDERLGLKAPYLMFTPDAARILAEALRFKLVWDEPFSDAEDYILEMIGEYGTTQREDFSIPANAAIDSLIERKVLIENRWGLNFNSKWHKERSNEPSKIDLSKL